MKKGTVVQISDRVLSMIKKDFPRKKIGQIGIVELVVHPVYCVDIGIYPTNFSIVLYRRDFKKL